VCPQIFSIKFIKKKSVGTRWAHFGCKLRQASTSALGTLWAQFGPRPFVGTLWAHFGHQAPATPKSERLRRKPLASPLDLTSEVHAGSPW